MEQFQLLLECYLSGQMSEKQWQEHLKDEEFSEWLENRNHTESF